ncbi:hypothetical protein DFH28DRAFT_1122892 [Melampsora americana]|nr:hypothetical protein DFH28DRAFT_1122892 [Melampsora americana]
MTGVSVTSGSESVIPSVPSEDGATLTTPRGRARAKMVFTDSEPAQGSATTSGTQTGGDTDIEGSASKGKGKSAVKPVSSRSSNKRSKANGSDTEL